MNQSTSNNICKISTWIVGILFSVFAFLWITYAYKYSVIKFISEIQFFHSDRIYFNQFISEPGGLLLYFSSFISQFFHYPTIGILILTLVLLLIYIVSINIFKQYGNTYRFFAFALIAPALLLFIYNSENASVEIKLAHFLGIFFSLGSFLIYLKISKRYQYIGGIIFYFILYFLTAGNALLFIALVIINELFQEQKSYLFLFLSIVLAALTPYLSYLFLYVTQLKTAYFGLTPFDLKNIARIYEAAWISTPVLLLFWILLNKKSFKFLEKSHPIILIICNFIIISGLIYLGIDNYNGKDKNKGGKKEIETIIEMASKVEEGDWNRVIELGKDKKFRNAVPVAYFTNIALWEKGLLPEDMFKYRQTGTYGLYNSWSIHHTTTLYIGELYYRLGIPAIAEQCAFEAMVTSSYEHSSRAVRRLVQTSMLRKDSLSFEKYIRLFEKAPVYKKWAKEQRGYFEKFLNNPDYKMPGFPETASFKNYFFTQGAQEHNMLSLLRLDPNNKKAFEYFSAFLLLKKNLFSFLELMDEYYMNMNYTKLPKSYEEALIILAFNDRKELIEKYNININTLNRFNALNKDVANAKTPKANQQVISKYKDTYWMYYKNAKPMMLEDIPGMMNEAVN